MQKESGFGARQGFERGEEDDEAVGEAGVQNERGLGALRGYAETFKIVGKAAGEVAGLAAASLDLLVDYGRGNDPTGVK